MTLGLLKKEDEEEEESRRRRMTNCDFFTSRSAYVKFALYSDDIHSFDWKSAVEHNGGFKMCDSVPSARYSSV